MKKYLAFLLTFLLLVSFASAVTLMPHPIYGKITHDGLPIKGLQVEILHEYSGKSAIAMTDREGYYQDDLGNFGIDFRDGDWVKVSLVYCKSLIGCQKRVQVSGGGNELTFDIARESLPKPPDEIIIVKYICWDGSSVRTESDCPDELEKYICWDESEVYDKSECPVQPAEVIKEKEIIEETKYVCEDGSEVENSDECPEKKSSLWAVTLGILSGLLAVGIAVLAKFTWGSGFIGLVKYYKKKGDEAKADGDYELASKYYLRAAKMIGTAINKAKDGKYK